MGAADVPTSTQCQVLARCVLYLLVASCTSNLHACALCLLCRVLCSWLLWCRSLCIHVLQATCCRQRGTVQDILLCGCVPLTEIPDKCSSPLKCYCRHTELTGNLMKSSCSTLSCRAHGTLSSCKGLQQVDEPKLNFSKWGTGLNCNGAARPANKHSHRRGALQASLMCKLAEDSVGGPGTETHSVQSLYRFTVC